MPITLYLQRQVPGQIWAASRSLLTPELGHELCWSLDLWGPGTKKLFRSLEHSRLVAPETAQHAGLLGTLSLSDLACISSERLTGGDLARAPFHSDLQRCSAIGR